jgi:glycosyltransferase involved in cell wall biosynthesis
MPQTCLVNLFHLDPAYNGGSSRIAREVSLVLAGCAEAQQLRVIFAVGWRFAEAFPDWLGYPQACVIPCLPEAGLTPLFRAIRPDLIVSPLLGTIPFVNPADYAYVPHVTAMSDISLAIRRPELLPAEIVQARLKLYQQLPEATRIVVPSEYARQGLIQDIEVSPHQVVVVPTIGLLLNYPKAPTGLEPEVPRPYLFYPANGWPHKRHAFLMRIMQEIWQLRPDMRLVLAGQFEAGFMANLIEQHSALKDRVINLGYIEDHRLSGLYHHAEALLHVSEYEGFGIPLVEAMAYGCPIICAPLMAMPEVAGEAALYVNSDNPADWAKAVLEELPQRRASMIAKGFARSAQFSWEQVRLGWLRVLKEAGLELSLSSASDNRQIWLPAGAVAAELKLWSGYHLRQYQELEAKEAEIQALAAAARAHIAQLETKEIEIERLALLVENLVEQLNMQKDEVDPLKVSAQRATDQLIAEEAFIQEQHREMVAKEAVIQSLKWYRITSFYFWLQRLRAFLRFLTWQPHQHLSFLRQLNHSFKPKIGQLYH